MPNPNPEPARKFRRDMIGLERSYVRDAQTGLKEARVNLSDALRSIGLTAALALVFQREIDQLRRRIAVIGQEQSQAVEDVSADLAQSQFATIGHARLFNTAQIESQRRREEIASLLASTLWVDTLSARLQADLAQLRAGGEEVETAQDQLFGELGSAWRAGNNNMELASQRNLWTVGVGLAAAYYVAGQAVSGERWFKQAVATLDKDTTETCMNVDGQIQPLDEPFEIVGEPSFADSQMNPPFHWNCRTIEILVKGD